MTVEWNLDMTLSRRRTLVDHSPLEGRRIGLDARLHIFADLGAFSVVPGPLAHCHRVPDGD